MELIIDNPNNLKLDNFCKWLKLEMLKYVNIAINNSKLKLFDLYINNNLKINYIDNLNRIIKPKSIILMAFKNLITIKNGNKIKIIVDPNINIPNSHAKLIDIIKLINYGNTQLNPYPIISNTFDYFTNNLTSYYIKYLKGIN